MPKVKARFPNLPQIYNALGKQEVEVGIENNETVNSLIDKIDKKTEQKIRNIIINPSSNKLSQDFLILINGRNIAYRKEGLNSRLKNGDFVVIMGWGGGG